MRGAAAAGDAGKCSFRQKGRERGRRARCHRAAKEPPPPRSPPLPALRCAAPAGAPYPPPAGGAERRDSPQRAPPPPPPWPGPRRKPLRVFARCLSPAHRGNQPITTQHRPRGPSPPGVLLEDFLRLVPPLQGDLTNQRGEGGAGAA